MAGIRSSDRRSSISPQDHVPFPQKLAYGVGGAVDWFTTGIIAALWMPVFNLGYGIAPGMLGLVMMIYRVWDAFTDPVMGNLSDNTRTRWGRRRPYIFAGAILAAAITPFMWRLDAGWSQSTMLVYITIVGILLYGATTMWAMPYNSMMLEMTPSYDERTRVAAVRTIFTKLGLLIGSWVLPFCASSYFADPVTGEPDILSGARFVSIPLSIAVVALGVLPAIFVKERYYAAEASKQPKEPLIRGLKDSMSIRPLWMMIGFVVFQMFGAGITGALGTYLNFFYISGGEIADASIIEGMKGTTAFLMGLIAVPFWTWVCEKLDKKWTMMIVIGSGFIGALLNLFCLTPKYPYLQIIPAVFYASVTASIWLIVPSMMADLADFDELKTGRRREGSINSVFSWFMKLGGTLPVGLAGFVLQWTGFDRAFGKAQPPEVLNRMLIWYICLPLAFWSVSLVLVYFYPLTRKRLADVRRQLEERRGQV